ncbi:speedy protein E4A-like isoform X4 [Suricata suricatta]|uniref:speedy protein E4A-like isoform X4 n=1 Tax=Suricata suricatta TaxID=37032 RepID=UPI0011560622|nr:speedy protein E4A-like isoform X4 [Suricata suricatta]
MEIFSKRIPSSRASWKLTFSSKCLIKYLQPQNEEGPRGLQSPQPHEYLLSVVSGCLATCTIGSTSSWPCSYIASDMEEDNPTSKQSIFQFLLGREHWPDLYKEFLKLKVEFFRAMGHRAWVTPELCEEIQAQNPHHWVWSREHQCAP